MIMSYPTEVMHYLNFSMIVDQKYTLYLSHFYIPEQIRHSWEGFDDNALHQGKFDENTEALSFPASPANFSMTSIFPSPIFLRVNEYSWEHLQPRIHFLEHFPVLPQHWGKREPPV